MGMGAVQRAAALLATCNQQLLEATRRLLMLGGRGNKRRHKTRSTTLGRTSMKRTAPEDRPQAAATATATAAAAELPTSGGELWRRSILMGEKCDPLNFSGAIFYDSNGRRLSGAPPRSPRHALAAVPESPIKGTGLLSSPLPPPPAASSHKWIAGY